MKTIAIIGTFDTKGREFKFLKDLVERRGLGTLCIHTGIYEPYFEPDVANSAVAAAAGEDIGAIAAKHDRALATDVMSRGAEKLVLGLPKNMDGSEGPRAEKSREFKKMLEENGAADVVLWDERRTTVAAHEILHRSGKKEKKHRQSVDAVAATLILQGYLDFKRRQ